MSKYHKIRWSKNDEQELKKAVRNFNAKLRRLEKKDPQTYNKNTLPRFYDSKTDEFTNRISVRQMKELINTRQDLKRELNSLHRFTKRGSEKIVEVDITDDTLKLTKWQHSEMIRRVNFINKRRAKRLKEIEETEIFQNGKSLGYTRGQLGMGRIELKKFEPLTAFVESIDKYSLKDRWRSILKQSQLDYFNAKDYQLRINFIKGMQENYNPEDIKDVVEAIENMDIGEFLSRFYRDPDAWTWDYPPNEEEYKTYLNHLKTDWLEDFEIIH